MIALVAILALGVFSAVFGGWAIAHHEDWEPTWQQVAVVLGGIVMILAGAVLLLSPTSALS